MGLPSSWESFWDFFFFIFGVFHLSPHTPLGAVLLSEDARETEASLFFSIFKHFLSCFSSFLVILAAASSAWIIASFKTCRFFCGISPVSEKDSHSPTCFQSSSPNSWELGLPQRSNQFLRQSRICLPGIGSWELRPLFLAAARHTLGC